MSSELKVGLRDESELGLWVCLAGKKVLRNKRRKLKVGNCCVQKWKSGAQVLSNSSSSSDGIREKMEWRSSEGERVVFFFPIWAKHRAYRERTAHTAPFSPLYIYISILVLSPLLPFLLFHFTLLPFSLFLFLLFIYFRFYFSRYKIKLNSDNERATKNHVL